MTIKKIDGETAIPVSIVAWIVGGFCSFFTVILVPMIVWTVQTDAQVKEIPKLKVNDERFNKRQIEIYYMVKSIQDKMKIEQQPIPQEELQDE